MRLGLFLALLAVGANFLPAQTWLTNRQIYDFEPGDVFHYSYTHNSPPVYTLRTILSRSDSSMGDTLIYEVLDTVYSLGQVPNWNMEIHKRRITYTRLDSLPQPGDQTVGPYGVLIERSADSFYCGWANAYRWSNAPDTVTMLGRKWYEETCAEGRGKQLVYQLGNNDIIYSLLSYYAKMDGCEGGNPIQNPNNASNRDLQPPEVYIFPNPANDWLHIAGGRLFTEYQILDQAGRNLANGRLLGNSLNISVLKPDVYSLVLCSAAGRCYLRWVKQ
jgi:hypothetical protein